MRGARNCSEQKSFEPAAIQWQGSRVDGMAAHGTGLASMIAQRLAQQRRWPAGEDSYAGSLKGYSKQPRACRIG